jgi:hypothetical protein
MGPKAAPGVESEYKPRLPAGRLPGVSCSLLIDSPGSEIRTGPKGADVYLIFRFVRLTKSPADTLRLALQDGFLEASTRRVFSRVTSPPHGAGSLSPLD